MADAKISELAAGTTPDGSELVEIVQGGVNVKVTTQDIANLGGGGGHVIEDEGTPLTQRANMNFTGAGVAVTDAGGKTVVTISGGGASAWDDTTAGTVERSTAGGSSESENIATQAAAGAASGLSASRAPSEVGLKDMLIKLFNTAVTWVAKMTFTAAPRFSSVTASQFLTVDGSKDLTSVAAATASDLVTGTDTTKPLTSDALTDFMSVTRSAASVSAGTMTLDCDSKRIIRFEDTSTISSNFTIALSNSTNVEIFHLTLFITGTIAITMPSSVIMETIEQRFTNGTKILLVTGITASPIELSFLRINGTLFMCKASYVYPTA